MIKSIFISRYWRHILIEQIILFFVGGNQVHRLILLINLFVQFWSIEFDGVGIPDNLRFIFVGRLRLQILKYILWCLWYRNRSIMIWPMNYAESTILSLALILLLTSLHRILLLVQIRGLSLRTFGVLSRQVILRSLIVYLRYHLLRYPIDLCWSIVGLNVRKHFSLIVMLHTLFRGRDTFKLIFWPLSSEELVAIYDRISFDMLRLHPLLL